MVDLLDGSNDLADRAGDAAPERAGEGVASPRRARRRREHQEMDGPTGTIEYSVSGCSLGFVLVGLTSRGVCAALLGDDPSALAADLASRFPGSLLLPLEAPSERATQAIRCIEGRLDSVEDLGLDLRGSSFQRMVWEALREIPAGTTATYGRLAERIGRPRSVRAVARACGANPVAVIVPCHRVVRSDGSLSGYRWGTERKRALLAREMEHAARTT